MTRELHKWQVEAIDYFNKHNNVIIEAATGSGKTSAAIEIIKEVLKKDPNIKVLIIVPKNVILETGWFKELLANGFSITQVGVYYGFIKEYAQITITNMQNIDRVAIEMFDFHIWDEVHNYGTHKMLEYVGMDVKYRLGLTATLERSDNSHHKINNIFRWNIFQYTPKEALDDNVLNKFDFVNIGVNLNSEDREHYNQLTKDVNLLMQIGGGYEALMKSDSGLKYKMLAKLNERKQFVNNYFRKMDVVKQIILKHSKSKIIVFSEYNKTTKNFYWGLLETGVRSCVLHSGVDQKRRTENLLGVQSGKYKVIFTSKVLDEGFNLPALDIGVIAAGNSTARQTIQRMGRVLRKKEKKSVLYQIYCVNTIENDYADERSKLFKDLCSTYEEYIFDGKSLEL